MKISKGNKRRLKRAANRARRKYRWTCPMCLAEGKNLRPRDKPYERLSIICNSTITPLPADGVCHCREKWLPPLSITRAEALSRDIDWQPAFNVGDNVIDRNTGERVIVRYVDLTQLHPYHISLPHDPIPRGAVTADELVVN